MTEKIRKGTTVTVTVNNPLTATHDELLVALSKAQFTNLTGTRVEYINSRKDDGRVCFGVTWAVEP